MKKKLTRLLPLILILMICTSCGPGGNDIKEEDVVGHGPEDYLGSYTETTYTNERYGIRFTAPTTAFEFALLDDILTANDIKADGYSNKKVPEILASGKDYMPMYGGDGNTGSNTSLVLSKVEKDVNREEFIKKSADSIREILEKDSSVTIKECEIKTGSPVGETSYFSYVIESNGKSFYTRQFYIFTDSDVACVMISATSDKDIETMHRAWKKIQ